MARNKSFEAIYKQRNRLLANIASNIGMGAVRENNIARYKRVEEIANRYANNIKKSKSAQRLQKSVNSKMALTREEYNEYRNKARNRKYSQSTYMGRING